MKIAFLMMLIPLFGLACAHEEATPIEVKGKVKGLHIHAPEFLKLTKSDIKKIDRALKTPAATNLTLSDEQTADCQDHLCHFKGKNLQGDFALADFKKFSSTIKKARASGKQETYNNDGPVTLRCTSKQCVADLNMDDDKVHEFSVRGDANTATDYSGFLLGSFIGGMVWSAAGH